MTGGSRCHPCERRHDNRRNPVRKMIKPHGQLCALKLPGCTRWATTFDHIVSLSRGGDHSPSNTQPACLHCNSSKQDRMN